MDNERITARFISEDRKVCVMGWWVRRGGCLYAGEISVLTPDKRFSFSSTSPMSEKGLSGYATPEYMARFAHRFVAR